MNSTKSERFTLTVNGDAHTLEVDGNTPLLDVLRNRLGLKGTRFGCGNEECGACFVLLDDRAVPACTTAVATAADRHVTTIEGLGNPVSPHALQLAFIAEQAAQCGYCTSGMLISAAALLQRTPRPIEQQIRLALDRNLCRCGSHNRAVRAVLRVATQTEAR